MRSDDFFYFFPLINGRWLALWRKPLPACTQMAAASKHSPGEVAWGALPLSL
jgi:hypothetical protein